MIKADIVNNIANRTGVEKEQVQANRIGFHGKRKNISDQKGKCIPPWVRQFRNK